MLRGKLRLHDVADTEAWCVRILQRSGLELSFHEREDALTYLIETAWELSLRYEDGVIHKGFSTWAGITLGQRLKDWQRKDGKRTKWQFADRVYERTLPSFVSLEHRPESPDLTGALDPGRNSDSPLEWVVRERDRERVRDVDALGEAEARRAA